MWTTPKISFGAMGDSFFEYLIKMWVQVRASSRCGLWASSRGSQALGVCVLPTASPYSRAFAALRPLALSLTRRRCGFGKPSKADPREQQDWILRCVQGGRAHPLAACGVGTLCSSPPALLETETLTRSPPRVAQGGKTEALQKSRDLFDGAMRGMIDVLVQHSTSGLTYVRLGSATH
jgi:hypothetical protein